MDELTFNSNSSNIASMAHDGDSTLTVTFRNGRTYRYLNCPVEVFHVSKAVEEQTGSCGSHFNKTIRSSYKFEEVV